MKALIIFFTACRLLYCATTPSKELIERLQESEEVLRTALSAGDQSIPRELIEQSHCLAVVPDLKQGAFIVGAKFGKGFLFCRQENGGWRGPATVRLEGASFGLQIGGGEADVILLVMNKTGLEKILRNKFKLGANAGLMVGPLGRTVLAQTDACLRAGIFGYSRARGLFAGISLDSSTLRQDSADNTSLYGEALSNERILLNTGPQTPVRAIALRDFLNQISTWEKK